jgi:hypothetical protein
MSKSEALAIVRAHLAGPGFLFALWPHLSARNSACVAKALSLIHQGFDIVTLIITLATTSQKGISTSAVRYPTAQAWT